MILKIGYKLEDIDFIKEEAKYYFEKVFDVQVEECEWEAADLKLAIEKNDADLDQIHIELEKGKGIITSNSKVGILIALYRFFHEFGVRYVRPGKEHEVYPSLTEADFFEKEIHI